MIIDIQNSDDYKFLKNRMGQNQVVTDYTQMFNFTYTDEEIDKIKAHEFMTLIESQKQLMRVMVLNQLQNDPIHQDSDNIRETQELLGYD